MRPYSKQVSPILQATKCQFNLREEWDIVAYIFQSSKEVQAPISFLKPDTEGGLCRDVSLFLLFEFSNHLKCICLDS